MEVTMKKLLVIASLLALLVGMSACVSSKKDAKDSTAPEPAAAAPAAAPAPEAIVLDEAVGPTTANTLADTVGSVTIDWKNNLAAIDKFPIKGANVKVVEYLGRKAIKVSPNFNNEIRVAFLFDKPTKLGAFKTINFSVAGFEGGEGAYNCGIVYTEKGSGAEHPGSFYLSSIATASWTDVKADLVQNEKWGNNYSPDREAYMIQFWSGSSKPIYITDVSFSK
jgi:hypothetical protein